MQGWALEFLCLKGKVTFLWPPGSSCGTIITSFWKWRHRGCGGYTLSFFLTSPFQCRHHRILPESFRHHSSSSSVVAASQLLRCRTRTPATCVTSGGSLDVHGVVRGDAALGTIHPENGGEDNRDREDSRRAEARLQVMRQQQQQAWRSTVSLLAEVRLLYTDLYFR